jgi:hypothetical protein
VAPGAAGEAILWQRVGTLAWIMGAALEDNPFRKYQALYAGETSAATDWRTKLAAWDRGWQNAARRARPAPVGIVRAYLPYAARFRSVLQRRRAALPRAKS